MKGALNWRLFLSMIKSSHFYAEAQQEFDFDSFDPDAEEDELGQWLSINLCPAIYILLSVRWRRNNPSNFYHFCKRLHKAERWVQAKGWVLTLTNILKASNGRRSLHKPITFASMEETGIPAIRSLLHHLTDSARISVSNEFVSHLQRFVSSVIARLSGISVNDEQITEKDTGNLRERWETQYPLKLAEQVEGTGCLRGELSELYH